MGRRTRLVLLAVAVLLAGVFVATAAALRFTDDSYFVPTGVVDHPYSKQFAGDGGCGPALPYQYRILNGALPPGLTLSSSGLISGNPTTAGTYSFWVELSDQNPPSAAWCVPTTAQREFSITVDPRIMVTNQTPAPGTVGATYTFGMQAVMKSGPDVTSSPSNPVTWSIQSGQLPPGLSLDTTTGAITGTPTTAGSYQFTALAVLDSTRSDTHGYTIVVRDALKITGPGLAGARSEVSVPYQATYTATGGSGTFTWSLDGGSLPQGVALGQDGSVSGTPHQSGRFAYTAAVTDTEQRKASVDSVLVVAPRLLVPKQQLRVGKVGRLYRARLVATGGVVPKIWKVAAGPLPRGVRLDRTTGILSGQPRKAGVYRITVQVTDGFKVVATRSLRITVLA